MTGRVAPSSRPTTPEDPTLASRPVPRKRAFPIRSFGPGADFESSFDIDDEQVRRAYWAALDRAAGASESTDTDGDALGNASLLRAIKKSEAITWRDDQEIIPQPTWGSYVFLTDYEQSTLDALPRAMENWVRALQRVQGAASDPPDLHAEEVYRRCKLDLVQEADTLADASPNRVRECFRSQVRSLDITDDIDGDRWVPPARNKFCFLLDATAVNMLAELTFRHDRTEEYRLLDACRVQAVAIAWQRPETARSSYRGVRDISIIGLARAYSLVDDGAFTLEDFPE